MDILRKKQRGCRQKLNRLIRYVDEFMPFKRTEQNYEIFRVPSGMFIQHPKTSIKIKTAFCKKWLETAEKFTKQIPPDLPFCKVVAFIDFEAL